MELPDSQNVSQTFVFLDVETTGLPPTRPKITEISLKAVHREELLASQPKATGKHTSRVVRLPRIVDSLSLCFDPGKDLGEYALRETGLTRQSLENSKKLKFDKGAAGLMKEFLSRQAPPVCLVAHNGSRFDFPLLKTEFGHTGVELSFPDEFKVVCGDTMLAFRALDGKAGFAVRDQWRQPGSRSSGGGKRQRFSLSENPTGATSGRFCAFDGKGRPVYRLPEVFKTMFPDDRTFGEHQADADVKTMIAIVVARADDLVTYFHSQAVPLESIRPMYQ